MSHKKILVAGCIVALEAFISVPGEMLTLGPRIVAGGLIRLAAIAALRPLSHDEVMLAKAILLRRGRRRPPPGALPGSEITGRIAQ